MKHMNGALIIGIAVFAGVCSAATEFGVVDFERIVKLHPNTAGDRKAIEEVYNALKSEGDVKAAKVTKAVQAFEEAAKEVQSPVLSESARKKAESEAKKKYDEAKVASDELKQLEDLHRMQLNERERKLLKRTTDAIRAVVKKIADEKKITIVLPTAPVLYYDETLDLTADVLRALGVDPAAVVPDEATAKEVTPAKVTAPVKEAAPVKTDPLPR
jgi:Skp family chaperone for outer membrane proteins